MDEERLKKMLRMNSGVDEKAEAKASSLGDMLPTLRKDQKGVITNDDLEKLFYALCGNTGKDYDSDDSIISDTDHMDPEDRAAKDVGSFRSNHFRKLNSQKHTTEILNSIQQMGPEIQCVEKVHASRENETKEEREARRRKNREFQMGLTTEEEKEAAEQKRQRAMKRQKKRLDNMVQVFTNIKVWMIPRAFVIFD